WKDPITGVPASGPTPVWRPLIPSAFDDVTIPHSLEYSHTFVEPETGDTVTDTWIGGYAVVVSKVVTIRAYCFSERLGTYIFSNEVDIVVILP
ncbi:hypothetical protein LRR18_18695, partial [Mangrovimonas sp. AS39]|uniref:hypothetical protein n=1 Tax=Mangrovimonas futianensis TaxID=2895523 RepID=UPI001E581B81